MNTPTPRPQQPSPTAAVGEAVKLAEKFAGVGLRAAGELLRHLPGR